MKTCANGFAAVLLLLGLVLAACAAEEAVPAEQVLAPTGTAVPEPTAPLQTDTPLPPTATLVLTPEPTPEPTEDPLAAIIAGAVERFNAGDLEGEMDYWADDARFYMFGMPPTGSEILLGKDQIRAMYEENIASHSLWEMEIDEIINNSVRGQSKNWHDFTREIGVAPLEASAYFEIADGKITSHTWTLTEESAERLASAMTEVMADVEAAAETSAEKPASEIKVTFANGTCSYFGPQTLMEGDIELTLYVREQDKEKYGLYFFTLDPGKSFMDLMAATGRPMWPDWAHIVFALAAGPGETVSEQFTAGEGMLYGVCLADPPGLPVGNVGPFTVSGPAEVPAEVLAADIVVRFAKDKCSVEWPDSLPLGEVNVGLIADNADNAYAMSFFNLEEGRTVSDLVAGQNQPSPPPWATMFSFSDVVGGSSKVYPITITAGPVFTMCWGDNGVIGSEGPIVVGE
ncbi:MAG: nuclear transport factor 2 family protein [Candidatus Promineifilaceae bacterium]